MGLLAYSHLTSCTISFQVVGSSRLPVSGAYCLASERAEQVLDLLKEAAENLNLQLNRDLSVFINVGAERIFDEVNLQVQVQLSLGQT